MSPVKDLTKEPPRSPRNRLSGYVIMARMIDKGRATIHGTVGEYHFACPLDQMLFTFKGVQADEVKKLLASSSDDAEVVNWFNAHGTPKTAEETKAWSDEVETSRPYNDPEKKDWFAGECAKLGLRPERSTLFDYLEADDAATFKK
ncbi:MAG: DUF5069 domain-containing protein [Verrucomicrobia bacterium]|nr:DUF5069 domain-containing protein [Verrucomicrobiota bacterium]